ASSGSVQDPSGIVVSADVLEISPWVASDGSGFLVVWEDHRDPSNPGVYGARVDAPGSVVGVGGIPLSEAVWGSKPSVAFAGGVYQVLWADSLPGLRGQRVDPTTGATLDGTSGVQLAGSLGSTASLSPRVCAAGAGFYASWVRYDPLATADSNQLVG